MRTVWKFAATALLGLAVMMSAPSGAAGAPHPLDPLRVTFSYWDHHWFVWLPRDPVFEAVEIHANDATEPGGKPLVWVYFTQRAVPKTQTNYTNNAAFADAKHWPYRDATGTPQSSSVSIDGVDVSIPVLGAADPLPFHAAYSPSTINAAILFGTSYAGFGTAASGSPDQLIFSEAPPPDAAHRLFVGRQYGASTELVTDQAGRTEAYRIRSGMHLLTIAFDPPLPAAGTASEQRSAWVVGVDDLARLESGSVTVHATATESVLNWQPETPDWTRAYPFRTTLTEAAPGLVTMNARTLRPSAP